MGETMSEWKGFFIEPIEQWSQLLGGCNWYTFHPIMIEFEDDRHMGGVECSFILLGLGFRARWNYRDTETTEELRRRIEKIYEDHPS